MTAPLDKTGANYPASESLAALGEERRRELTGRAEGYATSETVDALKPVATLVAGEDFTVSLQCTGARRGGGPSSSLAES